MIEGHGDDIHRYEAGMVRMNFSTNIYQQADHSALKAHLAERMDLDCAEIAQECVDYPTAYVQRVCRRVQNQQPYRDV